METDIKTKVIGVVASIALSLGGIYFFMIEPVNSKAKAEIKTRLKSPTYGPFDEALAKSAGMEDLLKKKPKWKLNAPPINTDWSNNFPTFRQSMDR